MSSYHLFKKSWNKIKFAVTIIIVLSISKDDFEPSVLDIEDLYLALLLVYNLVVCL